MSVSRVVFSSGKDSWSTPPDILERARQFMKIIYDPCPMYEMPNHVADNTALDGRFCQDGLILDWPEGHIFVNPPYSQLRKNEWSKKMIKEAMKGDRYITCLVASRTETKWFQLLLENCQAFVLIKGRLKFSEYKHSAPFPSALIYFGDPKLVADWLEVWKPIGLGFPGPVDFGALDREPYEPPRIVETVQLTPEEAQAFRDENENETENEKENEMGFSDGMDNTPKNPGRSEYILDGNHIFRVQALKEIDGHGGEGFVAELEVVDSDNPEMKIESLRGWVKLKKTNPKSAMAEVREFISILTDTPEEEVTEETFGAIVDEEEQPLAGFYIKCYAWTTKNKTNDGTYTHNRWTHIGDELGDETVPNSIKGLSAVQLAELAKSFKATEAPAS